MLNLQKMLKMKKIFAIAAFLAAAVGAGAQNFYDAITFSQNQYFGTARSVAMGNAMTAVGGDLGSVGINPAGSATSIRIGAFVRIRSVHDHPWPVHLLGRVGVLPGGGAFLRRSEQDDQQPDDPAEPGSFDEL